MQSPAEAATTARANSKATPEQNEFTSDLIDRQARKIARLCLVSYAAAAVIAGLAYGEVAR